LEALKTVVNNQYVPDAQVVRLIM